MEKIKLLSTNVKNKLQERIQIELLKRGFTAQIKIFQEVIKKNENYINFETEPFQTTPVIFKEITIGNFSSSVKNKTIQKIRDNEIKKFEVTNVWIQVNAHYQHFDRGSNSCTLFDFSCYIIDDDLLEVIVS